jgi:predicted PhzF superfamily epimerase YddE/YHI9
VINLFEVKVFCDDNGNYGDRHGIIIDEARAINTANRLKIATELGYAETVYVNDVKSGNISFFAQTEEIPFAGTAALAAAGMLRMLTGADPTNLVSQNHRIAVEIKDGLVWVTAELSVMPAWNLQLLASVESVERMTAQEAERLEHVMVWAWIDEKAGAVRARTFATDWLLPEAEANGSGSMLLAAQLGRPIAVSHGAGSTIYAAPVSKNLAKLGGLVVVTESPIKQYNAQYAQQ